MNSPSLYAHILGGGILLVAVVYLVLNASKIISREPYQLVVLMLVLSIATSMHGLSHLGLEAIYGYNPLSVLTGK